MIYFYLVTAALAVSDSVALRQTGGKKDTAAYLALTGTAVLGAFAYYTGENAPSLTRLLFSLLPHVALY